MPQLTPLTPSHFLSKNTPVFKHVFAVLFFLSVAAVCNANNNYYFSSSTGNDSYTSTQAQNPATPWKTISKLNAFFSNLVPGDNIYFKRGDTFYGSIIITKSGLSGDPISIGAYGTGNKPLISGLITLSSWSSLGGGIYQADAPAVKSTVNLVTLNGTPQGVGRYPNLNTANGGYLTYESYGSSSITDKQLSSSTNWKGAEVVIRKQHYAMEKCKITNQSGGTLSYTTTASINPLNNSNPSPVEGTVGFGYFIQRDPRTLDLLGEWYFNAAAKKMEMYFGSKAPSSYSIRVSAIDTLINIGSHNFIAVNNVGFEGANVAAIYAANAGNISVQSCDMNLMGGKGVLIFGSPNILIDNVTTNNILCGAIDLTSRKSGNVTVSNCNINNTAMIAGMGSFWDDNDYKAISVGVTSTAVVKNNNIQNTGFIAIQFQGSDILLKNNFINYYDIVKDDGGAIYTYETGTDAAPGTNYVNRVIQGNIVMNGVGAGPGTGGNIDVDGIFLDGRIQNVDILDNTLANIGVNGIYVNNSINVNIRGNTCFNNGSGIGMARYTLGYFKNLSVKQNIFYPKYNTQWNVKYADLGINQPVINSIQSCLQKIGDIDSNYYATPGAQGFYYYYAMVNAGSWIFPKSLTISGWRTMSGNDNASKITPPIASYKLNSLTGSNLFSNGQFTSNISGITTYSLSPITTSWDKTNKITGAGSLKIVSSALAGNSTLVYGSIGAVSSSKNYIFRFTTLGTSNNSALNVYLRQSASPRASLTPIQTSTYGTTKIVHEFLFNAPTDEAAASFMIELQSVGTTYIDDIAVYEADATLLDIDSQLKFEYNETKVPKTVSLDASYIGVDNTIYNGTITLQPFTSKILVKNGPVTGTNPASTLTASSSTPAISCFGSTNTVTIYGSGGTAPLKGTGTFTEGAGKGSLKISVPNPVNDHYTYLYSTVGGVTLGKTYVLRFSTLGTTTNGNLRASIRERNSPWNYITPTQSATFGTGRVDHQFTFTTPVTDDSASFLIELLQTSGTTYIDNIGFFEANSAGTLISDNLYDNGNFENGISGITTWSNDNNHVATFDQSSKINNIYYFPVTDADGNIVTVAAKTYQPAAKLVASSSAGTITTNGGKTTVRVTALGGTEPYTGTGSFTVKAGTYSYTVTDAVGCTSVSTITVNQSSAGERTLNTDSTAVIAGSLSNTLVAGVLPLSINTYPNPTNAEFNLSVQGGSAEPVNIQVMTIDGRLVYKAKGTSNKQYIFGNNFNSGIYFVQVQQGNTIQTVKAIKVK